MEFPGESFLQAKEGFCRLRNSFRILETATTIKESTLQTSFLYFFLKHTYFYQQALLRSDTYTYLAISPDIPNVCYLQPRLESLCISGQASHLSRQLLQSGDTALLRPGIGKSRVKQRGTFHPAAKAPDTPSASSVLRFSQAEL